MNAAMRRYRFVLAAALLAAGSAAAKPVAYVGATLVSPQLSAPIDDSVILVDQGKIQKVGRRQELRLPQGTEIVEMKQRWVMPALVDAHVHYFQSGGLYTRPDVIDLRRIQPYEGGKTQKILADLPDTFARYLRSGITTTVDMGGPFSNFAVRQQAQQSERAPRVVTTGPLLSTYEPAALATADRPIVRIHDSDEAIALIRRQKAAGADLIKIWFIVRDPSEFDESLRWVRAAIEESHRLGLRVAIHATELETARASVEAGADILVHSVTDRPVDAAFLELLRAHDTIVVTTLIVSRRYENLRERRFVFEPSEYGWANPFLFATLFDIRQHPDLYPPRPNKLVDGQDLGPPSQIGAANLKRMLDAGVRVAVGTDAGNIGTFPGPSLQAEFHLLQQAGFAPRDLLQSATIRGAEVAGLAQKIGTIEAGKQADLLFLDADPLLDMRNTGRVRLVVKDGIAFTPAELIPADAAAVVQQQLNAYNAHDVDAFVATYAPDAEIFDDSGARLMAGQEEIRARYGAMFQRAPSLQARILTRMVNLTTVVDLEEVTGLREQPSRAIATYIVKDGLIRSVRLYRGQ